MSSTFTHSQAQTFTITDAQYLASKVQTDLMRLHRLYSASHGHPTESEINDFYKELVLLQQYNLLDEIEYGFCLGSSWVKALKYTARQGGVLTADDDPGGIRYSSISPHAQFTSILRYNSRGRDNNLPDKRNFLNQTPVRRISGPGLSGEWQQQRAYSSGGRGLLRGGI